ncbi:MAG: HAMP domain-containing protein [Acidobacteria bacterium]|nr:HAMP domain-containing protein [Acidobacteriota bacterium]
MPKDPRGTPDTGRGADTPPVAASDGAGIRPAGPASASWLARVFLTLRGRLILLVCFTAVPSLLFIFFAAARERASALELMETEARHLGSLASREHAHQLNGGRNLLLRLASVLPCEGAERAKASVCPDYLPALLSGFPQFANIGLAATGGEIACSAAPIARPASLKANTAFHRALESRDVETGTYAVGFVGRPVLHLAHAIRGADGAACGVAFVAVELGWLDQLAEQADLPADYSLIITDRTGHVLARSGAAHDAPLDVDGAPPLLAPALGRPRGAVLEVGSPPASQYFVATPMEGTPGVFVVAGLPYQRVREAANRAFYRTLLALALVTMFAIASAVVAAEFSVLRALRALTRAVRRFGAGDLSARAPLPGSHGELRELALSFSAMADALSARQREAREAQERLRALSHRLQEAREEEAGRIARELHDELGQVLTGLKMELTTVWRTFARGASAGTGDSVMAGMGEQIDRAIDAVRRLSSELRPPVLDRLGLAAAVDWLVRDRESKSGLAIVLNLHDLREPIHPQVSITLFRIVQEALTNVIRHARATEVAIDLTGHDTTLSLSIHDNGIGLDPSVAEGPHSLGILGMRERVRLVGGTFRIDGGPGRGTTITVEVPREPPRATPAGGSEPEP